MRPINNSNPSALLSKNAVSCLVGCLALLALATPSSAQAQFTDLTVTNSLTLRATPQAALSMEMTAAGGLRLGNGTGTGSTFNLGGNIGTLLLWDQTRGTFRAGHFAAWEMDPPSIGWSSVAFGIHCVASGDNSFAAGGGSLASGSGSFAVGNGNVAAEWGSVALGSNSVASAYGSVAIGNWNFATGAAATAMGFMSTASGEASAALGCKTRAESFASFVIGQFNVGGHSAGGNEYWVLADPVFEIGIGDDDGVSGPNYRNAMTVYKNGRVIIHQVQGDILMGEFGN
jgi:hypothetical protein